MGAPLYKPLTKSTRCSIGVRSGRFGGLQPSNIWEVRFF